MTIREGKWKCTYCGEVNRGRDVECTACGAAREKDVVFFLEDDAPEVTDEAELAVARGGAEWMCETCGASNPSVRETCEQCGAPRGGSIRREERFIPATPPPAPAPPVAQSAGCFAKLGMPVLIGAGAVALVVVALLFFLFRSHEVPLEVANVEWQRTVQIEELQTLTEEAWENEVPSDARVVSRRRELHHNEQVQVGTRSEQETYTERVQTGTRRVKVGVRDLGNGYFEDVYKDEPVYQDQRRTRTVQKPVYQTRPVYQNKVKYQIDRWRPVGPQTLQGQNLQPAWPAVGTSSKRREAKRESKYVVTLKDPSTGKTYVEEVSESDFARYAPGSTVKGKVNNLGTLTDLEP
jgi:hypothetical protein